MNDKYNSIIEKYHAYHIGKSRELKREKKLLDIESCTPIHSQGGLTQWALQQWQRDGSLIHLALLTYQWDETSNILECYIDVSDRRKLLNTINLDVISSAMGF